MILGPASLGLFNSRNAGSNTVRVNTIIESVKNIAD